MGGSDAERAIAHLTSGDDKFMRPAPVVNSRAGRGNVQLGFELNRQGRGPAGQAGQQQSGFGLNSLCAGQADQAWRAGGRGSSQGTALAMQAGRQGALQSKFERSSLGTGQASCQPQGASQQGTLPTDTAVGMGRMGSQLFPSDPAPGMGRMDNPSDVAVGIATHRMGRKRLSTPSLLLEGESNSSWQALPVPGGGEQGGLQAGGGPPGMRLRIAYSSLRLHHMQGTPALTAPSPQGQSLAAQGPTTTGQGQSNTQQSAPSAAGAAGAAQQGEAESQLDLDSAAFPPHLVVCFNAGEWQKSEDPLRGT